MEIIPFLIPIALLLGGIFVGGFVWMTMSGQYDDLETPGHRMLLDDDNKNSQLKVNINNNKTGEGEV